LAIDFFIKGLIIGFSIAAPVGPIGALCMRRTLTDGLVVGLASGLGAASADAVYGLIAAFGLTFITGVLLEQELWLRLFGGAFLLYLGFKIILSEADVKGPDTSKLKLYKAFGSTFFLTLTNPLTILSFAAVFAGLGLGAANSDYMLAGLLVFGVFTGSSLWWLLLSSSVTIMHKKLDIKLKRWINLISGLIISGFGLMAIYGAFR